MTITVVYPRVQSGTYYMFSVLLLLIMLPTHHLRHRSMLHKTVKYLPFPSKGLLNIRLMEVDLVFLALAFSATGNFRSRLKISQKKNSYHENKKGERTKSNRQNIAHLEQSRVRNVSRNPSLVWLLFTGGANGFRIRKMFLNFGQTGGLYSSLPSIICREHCHEKRMTSCCVITVWCPTPLLE